MDDQKTSQPTSDTQQSTVPQQDTQPDGQTPIQPVSDQQTSDVDTATGSVPQAEDTQDVQNQSVSDAQPPTPITQEAAVTQPDANAPTLEQPQTVPDAQPQAVPGTPEAPASQPQSTDQTQPNNADPIDTLQAQDDYVENVGGSVIDLLEDVNENEDLVQMVAEEMRLDEAKLKSILSPLLDKIHNGQITIDELALIMAAPVVDEEPDELPTGNEPAK